MTTNDTDALLDRLRRNAQAPMDRFDRLHGLGGFPEYGEDERPFPDEVLKLLDLLAVAEHRATRAEAQAAVRGRAVVIYRERAREAEARVRDLAQEVKDERGACLDQMEQVRIRDARIRHLEDTARVLVKEALTAEDARDEHRRGKAAAEARIAEEKRLRMKATAAATEAEARIKAVEDVLSKHESILCDSLGVPVDRIRRALDGG